MDLIQCQFMTVLIILLLINVGLVIGVFLKWNFARTHCKGGIYTRSFTEREGSVNVFENQHPTITQDYPFVVGITVTGRGDVAKTLHCGGVIVGIVWALTAGHCIDTLKGIPNNDIMVHGGSKLWRISFKHEVVFMIHHNDFNNYTFDADVGLVKVKQPFDNNFESQILIAGKSYNYQVNSTVTVVGWTGAFYNEEFRAHDILNSVEVLILDCNNSFPAVDEQITESMFCAGTYTGEKPGCHLDSGGPVLDGDFLIGVVSWGKDCGQVDQPIVYTKIPVFEEWIRNVIKYK